MLVCFCFWYDSMVCCNLVGKLLWFALVISVFVMLATGLSALYFASVANFAIRVLGEVVDVVKWVWLFWFALFAE